VFVPSRPLQPKNAYEREIKERERGMESEKEEEREREM